MFRFFITRLIQSAISIALVIVAVFFMSRMTGDVAELYLPIDTPDAVKREFAALHGLDQPLLLQFLHFLGDLSHLDLGQSMRLNMPASEAIAQALPTTVTLAAVVIPLSLLLAVGIGALAALKPNGIFDRMASGLSLAAASTPDFWVAIVCILIFAVWLHWLPSSGYGNWVYWVLPVSVLIVRPLGNLVQVVRGALVDALAAPYVKTAIAKGIGSQRILFCHCLRNAMIPVVTMVSDAALNILNGVVIIEVMFGFPGLGRLMLDSVIYRDYGLLQALVIVTASLVFIVTTITDIFYALLDPRVRHE